MIHALKANRIGFVDVSNPPPWVGTAEGGLVTPFEVYRKNKTVLIKLEFSPHRSEEAEFAKNRIGDANRQRHSYRGGEHYPHKRHQRFHGLHASLWRTSLLSSWRRRGRGF